LVAKGHSFETSSDTEVVLRGYLQWGEALADRLNGMYAFAIWDTRERKLVMIRDRMGVKPFYFYPIPDGVLFGSEPKAVFANPMAPRSVDLEGLRELIGPVTTSGTAVWKGMREVKPGTIVTVDERGIRERTYWRLESRLHTDDRDTTVANVRGLLDDIVRRQLVADVPECVLLSGGLDSSAPTRTRSPNTSAPTTPILCSITGRCPIPMSGERLSQPSNSRWAASNRQHQCTCCSKPSGNSRRWRCPARPPTRSSAGTGNFMTHRSSGRMPQHLRPEVQRRDSRSSPRVAR
jgi:asparagine synthase (glutamine-hydrolysing)